jgi:hypothetical protein
MTLQLNELGREKYGYFLIWGNGLAHKSEVIDLIKKEKRLEIVMIKEHEPKSTKKLVKEIYSYDYAPFWHLKGKTNYLLNSPAKVLFIFFKNNKPEDNFFGKDKFRHIECEFIKKLKDKIRDKYNPKINGKRSEEHILHASDNESQTNHALKYLGYKKGLKHLRQKPNKLLKMPFYVPSFKKFEIKKIKIENLYCNVLTGDKKKFGIKTIEIENSPQFKFLKGKKGEYQKYLKTFLGGPLTQDYSTKRFEILSKNFNYLKKPFSTEYLITKKSGDKYVLLDGLHRASIVKYNDVKELSVVVVK